MIDIQATIEKFGYNPNTLMPQSNRKVVNVCHKNIHGREYQFVDKYLEIMGPDAQECAFINRVNCWNISSETISSQACPVMDLKVQRLTPDTQDGCVMETRVPYIQMDDDIVRACMRMQEVPDKELDR